jgi:hypothetical protein
VERGKYITPPPPRIEPCFFIHQAHSLVAALTVCSNAKHSVFSVNSYFSTA